MPSPTDTSAQTIVGRVAAAVALVESEVMARVRDRRVWYRAAESSPLEFVTAADRGYLEWYRRLARSLDRRGYPHHVYDLGGLGFGTPYQPEIALTDGRYHTFADGWTSYAIHKPGIIADVLTTTRRVVVYVDADIVITRRLDEVATESFDVGLTVRPLSDVVSHRKKGHFDYAGYCNAGVLFFRANERTQRFLQTWRQRTIEVRNDQKALNQLINPTGRELNAGDRFVVDDCQVLMFSSSLYNLPYREPSDFSYRAKIVHFSHQPGQCRDFDTYGRSKLTQSFRRLAAHLRL